jgi:hypothetical protein
MFCSGQRKVRKCSREAVEKTETHKPPGEEGAHVVGGGDRVGCEERGIRAQPWSVAVAYSPVMLVPMLPRAHAAAQKKAAARPPLDPCHLSMTWREQPVRSAGREFAQSNVHRMAARESLRRLPGSCSTRWLQRGKWCTKERARRASV